MDGIKDLLPTWGWGVFAAVFGFVGLVYLGLGQSIIEDWCTGPRYHCKSSNHAMGK